MANDFPDEADGTVASHSHSVTNSKTGPGSVVGSFHRRRTTTAAGPTVKLFAAPAGGDRKKNKKTATGSTNNKKKTGGTTNNNNNNNSHQSNNDKNKTITPSDLDIIQRQLEMTRKQLEERDVLDETFVGQTETSGSTETPESTGSDCDYSEGSEDFDDDDEDEDDSNSIIDDDDDSDFLGPLKKKALLSSSSKTKNKKDGRGTKSTAKDNGKPKRGNKIRRKNVDTGGFPTDPSRVKLHADMKVLADGIHLDKNTRTLLAVYDARSIEDFFLMGEYDLNHMLAKARASNRGLPPLQIRKVKILRQWIADIVDDADPDKLPEWAKKRRAHGRRAQGGKLSSSRHDKVTDDSDGDEAAKDQSLIPDDWEKRFNRDLPKLKKKLRAKGDSFTELFPWLSYVINARDMVCGSAPKYCDS